MISAILISGKCLYSEFGEVLRIMKRYVKFGMGWTFAQENGLAVLSNALTSELYKLGDAQSRMASRINAGTTEEELLNEFGSDWDSFKSELEHEYAIYYSNQSRTVRDVICVGSLMATNSAFIKIPPRISRLTVQISDICNCGCEDCGKPVCFPCFSCDVSGNNEATNFDRIANRIEFLSQFGITELFVTGGDPLMDFAMISELFNLYHKRNPMGSIKVITNGALIPRLNASELDSLKRNATIMLIVTKNNTMLLDSIIDVLNNHQISFDLIMRNMAAGDDAMFHNDTLAYREFNNIPVVDQTHIIRPSSIFNNNNALCAANPPCFDGQIFISHKGDISVCRGYKNMHQELNVENGANLIEAIKELWLHTTDVSLCKNCGLAGHCLSCRSNKEVFAIEGGSYCSIIKQGTADSQQTQ